MAYFQTYLPQLLRFEGGYVDNPYDPGGATNMGITLSTFEAHSQTLLGIAPTLNDLRALTQAQAGTLYKTLYWDPLHGDAIALQYLADIVFDFYVNAGFHAIVLLQQLLGPPLCVDGRFGPETLAALLKADQPQLYARYRAGRIAYYCQLAQAHPLLQRFLAGWLARAHWFPAQAPG
ncbi:N-acetylmuramidase [Lysobacter sp. BMK333-48F3]|uniref:glycoside hydrolase family 108 protein n=1 Tax=Lysobacter sp. BMK333-48F3 TaxID=2867962 RepID=UPI001C8C1E7A|nr:glycosyl hydrolase 108 family protein [Lysobacter sp. BMK333-48F3]MBX9403126.1 N-acetylmuramidase [Lysobacter sp. BMK333-48F3]